MTGRLRRAARRRTVIGWPLPPLPDSQLELLHWIRGNPGRRPQDAAAALGAAPNTVSTLVKSLLGAGLLDREPDPNDGRSIRLLVSEEGRRRLAEWRDHRQRVIAEALTQLQPSERRAIEEALPALFRIVAILEGEA